MREITKIRLAISYYCELGCRHCYVPQQLRKGYAEIEKNELSVEQINSFVDYLQDVYNLQKLDITGGEALLTKVWPRTKAVVGHALRRGLEVQINTTGSGNIAPEVICEAFRVHLDKLLLHVSLDGTDPAYVDAFRGRKGAYERSINFMKEALNLGIKVRTRLTITNENLDQVGSCYDLVSGLGVTSFMCKPVNIAGNSIVNHLENLTMDTLRDVQMGLLAKSVGNTTQLHLPAPLAISRDDIPEGANVEIFHCTCGQHLVYIAYNGAVYPCTYMAGIPGTEKYVIGNIKDPDFDFAATWEHPDTYKEFRNSELHVCMANKILAEYAACH